MKDFFGKASLLSLSFAMATTITADSIKKIKTNAITGEPKICITYPAEKSDGNKVLVFGYKQKESKKELNKFIINKRTGGIEMEGNDKNLKKYYKQCLNNIESKNYSTYLFDLYIYFDIWHCIKHKLCNKKIISDISNKDELIEYEKEKLKLILEKIKYIIGKKYKLDKKI